MEEILLREYPNSPFSFSEVLLDFGMSQSTLTRKTKQHFGTTPQICLRNFRLEKAYQKLQSSTDSVAMIAESCGFNSISYFNRVFKMMYGDSPTNSRKLKTK